MNPLSRWRERWRVDRELAEEMAGHILERAEQLMEAGQSEAEATRNAHRQFGNAALQRERSRDAWGWSGVEEFVADVRFGCRLLLKSPGFTTTALLTLALAIGSATAVFTVVDSVLLRPLSFPQSGALVVAWERVPYLSPTETGPNPRHADLWRKRATAFTGLVLMQEGTKGVAFGTEHPRIAGSVTAETGLFDVLGVRPAMGRGFTHEDGIEGRNHVVILTWGLWQSWFHGDPGVIGKQVRVADTVCEVIGVLPESFRFPNANALRAFHRKQGVSNVPEPGIFQPATLNPAKYGWNSEYGNWLALARLRPGVSLREAETQLASIEVEVVRQMHAHGASISPQVFLQPMQQAVVGSSQQSLWLLMAAVSTLLLTACLTISRRREAAVRSALGASRWRLLRSALAENLVLAMVGGAAGVLLAVLGLNLFRRYSAVDIPRLGEVHLNFAVLLFSLTITVGATLLFGLLPAMRLMRTDPQAALQSHGSRVMGSRRSARANGWLVGLEVAGCVTLLMTTAFFGKSLVNLLTQDKGFDTGHVAVAQVDLSSVMYPERQKRAELEGKILSGVRAIPGVESAGLVSAMPLEGETWIEQMNRSDRPHQETPLLNLRWVSAGYFETLRQRLVAGRFFEEGDRDLRSVVLSEGFARAVWPGENPLGAKVKIAAGRDFTVIGIAADTHSTSLKTPPPAMAYAHYSDRPPFTTFFMARGRQPAEALLADLRQAIWKAAPDATVNRVKTLDAQLSDSIAGERLQTVVLISFGSAALALAMLGIYGVLSCSVAARKQEIGVRLALGATRRSIYAVTFGEAYVPVAGGLTGGLAAGFLVFRLVRSLLFGILGVEPAILAMVIALFLASALAAGFLPARRAASIDPMDALRME
ncbi:MAG: ABC transporter permease [Bryobacteraceae bacterium]